MSRTLEYFKSFISMSYIEVFYLLESGLTKFYLTNFNMILFSAR